MQDSEDELSQRIQAFTAMTQKMIYQKKKKKTQTHKTVRRRALAVRVPSSTLMVIRSSRKLRMLEILLVMKGMRGSIHDSLQP